MAKNVDVMSYLPPVLQDYKELKEIAAMENPILNALWQKIDDELNNQFVVTVNREGATRYENMLKLNRLASDTLDVRRFRILAKYNNQAPYTRITLMQILDNVLGEDNYELTISNSEKFIKIRINLTLSSMVDSVNLLLEQITPQNLVLDISPMYYLYSDIDHVPYKALKKYQYYELLITPVVFTGARHRDLIQSTHEELSNFKHITIDEEGIGNA
ncbi:putative phage tail protein [Solibacillus silvestris]|uniref:putative phage tail protein n=1 Tax=Solibacillus silvestris TaxID=76853 RepID=UPI003F8049EB